MSFAWNTAEAALRVWLTTAIGGSPGVIFANQNGPRPTGTFFTIQVGNSQTYGAVDESTWTYSSTPAHSEITFSSNGQRSVTVQIQAFTDATIGGTTARTLLLKAQNALALDSIRSGLQAAGLAPFDIGTVKDLTGIIDTKFYGRAALDVQFYYTDSASDSTGYIAEVEGTGTVTGSTDDPLTVNFDIR